MNSVAARFAFLVAAMLATSALSAFAGSPEASAKGDDQTEREIRQLNGEEVAAFLRKDPQALARLWSDEFVVTNPLNKFVNKRAVLGMVTSGMLQFSAYDRQIEYVRVYGDTVIVAGHETVLWAGSMPNAGKTQHLRFTSVWMRQDDRWQQVARHANVVPEA